ncbi:hypothetical protein VaNZ11_012991, partial [Volvox africanus]
ATSMVNITTSRLFEDSGNRTLDLERIFYKLLKRPGRDPGTFVHIVNSAFLQNSCSDVIGVAGGAIFSKNAIFIQLSSFISNICPTGGAIALSLLNPSDYVAV